MDQINGKTIWIVGASSGIGEALARELSDQGAKLILSARRKDALDDLNKDLGGKHHVEALDVSDVATLKKAFKSVDQKIGSIDRIIFMAAIYETGGITDKALDKIQNIINVNIGGAFNLVVTALPYLKRGSQLVLTGSVAGYRGLPNAQPYCATKAALINLAESLHIDLKDKGIDVKVINPGFVETPLTDLNDFPMPMIITPDKAAKAIAKGLTKGAFEIHFPKGFTFIMKFLRMLPNCLYLPLARKATPK